MPEIVFATLDEAFGRTEPDEEIQDLLKASIGLNLAIHYLSGAITFDPTVTTVDTLLASKIVWHVPTYPPPRHQAQSVSFCDGAVTLM